MSVDELLWNRVKSHSRLLNEVSRCIICPPNPILSLGNNVSDVRSGSVHIEFDGMESKEVGAVMVKCEKYHIYYFIRVSTASFNGLFIKFPNFSADLQVFCRIVMNACFPSRYPCVSSMLMPVWCDIMYEIKMCSTLPNSIVNIVVCTMCERYCPREVMSGPLVRNYRLNNCV